MKGGGTLLRAWLLTLLVAVPLVGGLPWFFRWLAPRPGSIPWEPLHALLGPVDLSAPLFVLLYGAVAFALVQLWSTPWRLLRAARAYLILLLLRMVTMALYTLEPPADMIVPQDPITLLFYPDHRPYTKDLFFSGHVATLLLLAWAQHRRTVRQVFIAAALLMAVGVVAQHFHWTVDVMAAPFFAWMAWRASGLIPSGKQGE